MTSTDDESAAQVAIEREMRHRQEYGLFCPPFAWQAEQVT